MWEDMTHAPPWSSLERFLEASRQDRMWLPYRHDSIRKHGEWGETNGIVILDAGVAESAGDARSEWVRPYPKPCCAALVV